MTLPKGISGPDVARGIEDTRPAVERANAVPTRHAAIDCTVLLAGSWVDDRPVIHDLTSTITQTVIHSHEIQAMKREPLKIQWAMRLGSNVR